MDGFSPSLYGKFKFTTSLVFSAAAVSCVYTALLAVGDVLSSSFSQNSFLVFYYVISVGFIVSVIFLSVIFFIWVYALIKTVRNMGIKTETKPGTAVLWFFIPLFNLFKPYLILRDAWLALRDENSAGYGKYSVIKVWWAMFLFSGIFSKLAWQAAFRVEDLKSLKTAEYLDAASMTLNIVYAVSLILLVSDFWHKFRANFVKLSGATAS